MEQEEKYIGSRSAYENHLEKLKSRDMNLLYENFPMDESKHSLNDYFSSLSSFLKFLSNNIDYSTNLIDKFLIHLENNRNPDQRELLLDAIRDENKAITDFMNLLSDFFESRSNLKFENIRFNKVMDDILVKIAEYTESKKISIFKKFGTDVLVKINEAQFYLACLQIIKSWCENISENGVIYITTNTKNKNKIEIEFRDDNLGIPDEILKYIFEPSNPLEHDWEFNLVLANKIIKDHLGKISVRRSEEVDALVITLPIITENELENLINERLI